MSEPLLLKDFKPTCMLNTRDTTPEKPRFTVIDAHNHLFGDVEPSKLVEIMDQAGVEAFVNVTGNVSMPYDEKGYTIERRELDYFMRHYCEAYPGRFYAFTMSDFAQWNDFTLIKDDCFAEGAIRTLEKDLERGAIGLKVTKELGLAFTDYTGSMIPVDDERLDPIWKRAGELGIPVLIHTSDPAAFFLPIDEKNEHYLPLHEFPGWHFQGSFFSKEELLAQRNRMIAKHPRTTFICPHVANHAEDLIEVSEFMDCHPNVFIDFSARVDELGRQPYSARDFLIKYQDRIIFGVDMPVTPEIYRFNYRFLETRDEYFDYPDYMGRWGYSRWHICALDLPDSVLKKIYRKNFIENFLP